MPLSFRFDTHIHTAETSKCGRIPAKQLVEKYHALGYHGIGITDHLHAEYIDLLYCCDDWDTCVDRFLDGYRIAKMHGDKVGLCVVLGCELRFLENDNDYLIYGIDEAFLRSNPYPYKMGPQAFFERFGEDLLILHAHPFREGNSFVRHDCIHGFELINANPRHDSCNAKAFEFAKQMPWLHRVCGSDTHREGEEALCWMLFDRPVTDSFEFRNAILQGGYQLGCRTESEQRILCEALEYFS